MNKQLITKLGLATLVATLATGCAATEFTEPGNVSKSGTDLTSGVIYDSSKLTISGYAAPSTFSICTGGTDFKSKINVGPGGVMTPNYQSITSQTGPGSSGYSCGEAQQVALMTNAKDNTWKSVATGTVNWGTLNIGNQELTIQRAFSADFDKDGKTDSVAYTVTLSGSSGGSVTITRTIGLSSSGSCTTSNSTPCAAATTSAWRQITGITSLTTPGDHTFVITLQTQAGTANAGGAVAVTVDGTTVTNGTTSGIENPGASMVGGPIGADPVTTGILVSGTAAAPWAILNNAAVPVNALNLALKGGTGSPGAQTAASYPTLKSLTWTR
jgi:hypothetical protein